MDIDISENQHFHTISGDENDNVDHDGEIFQYTCGEGWERKGQLDPQLESRQQYGTYTINDESQKQKDILNVCDA